MAVHRTPDPVVFRLGLLGGFGGGNTGNDATAQVVVDHLRRERPHVDVSLVVYHAVTGEGPGGARLVSYVDRGEAWSRRQHLPPVLARALAVVDGMRSARAVARNLDALVVLGGGVFEAESTADVGVRGAATFVTLALSARHLSFVAIGASPTRNRLDRAVARLTLQRAEDRSYRDRATKDALEPLGADVMSDRVTCDLVFARPAVVSPRPSGGTRLGIGVMGFPWLRRTSAGEIDPEDGYVRELALVVRAAVERGWSVDLFIGDTADLSTLLALEDAVERLGVVAAHVAAHREVDLESLVEKMRDCHVVVGSRFHNLIAAFLVGRPAVALADRLKVRELMRDVGLSDYLQEARSFEADAVVRLLEEVVAHWPDLHRRVARRVGELHAEAGAELARLTEQIGAWRSTTTSAPEPVTVVG